MELDVPEPAREDDSSESAKLFSVPEEIWLKMFCHIDPLDVLALGRSCRFFSKLCDNEEIWRYQWYKLASKHAWLSLNLPSVQSLAELGVLFKDSCRRLWSILSVGGSFQKCIHCKNDSCTDDCLKESSSKIVMDIGGKWTWVINANLGVKKHMSMIAVPKLLRCYDCDSILDRKRTQAHCDCDSGGRSSGCVRPSRLGELHCGNRSVSSHTGLEYFSQQLSQLSQLGQADRPLCLFCEEYRTHRLLCEKEMVLTTKVKLAGCGYSSVPDDSHKSHNPFKPFTNGYCKDTANILGAENLDLLSPLIALDHSEAFPIVKAFLSHLFSQFQMIDELQRPASCLVFTEPPHLPLSVKERLLRFLFEDVQISRLCLLPKALAISYIFDVDTCIVVDSGATNTTVWVVVEGKVDTERTRTLAVGGWHVSQFLKQALAWRDQKEVHSTTVSSLDASHVKARCRLSLNIQREEARPGPARTETLHVKSVRGRGGLRGAPGPGLGLDSRLEYTEINLSSELYLAPEMMYASLDLVNMIVDSTEDLPAQYLKDCFSHILIQGGNTDLQGFVPRLSSDLREALPEHAAIINVCTNPTGNHSWNSAMGANMAKVPNKYDDILRLHEPGTPFWISREEYVLFGCHQLTETGGLLTEM